MSTLLCLLLVLLLGVTSSLLDGRPPSRKPRWLWGRLPSPPKATPLPQVCGQRNFARIVGGIESERHSWPWMVSLRNFYGAHFCGGSLITSKHVLTAAHCISWVWLLLPWLGVVVVGGHTLDDGQDLPVASITVHEDFGVISDFDADLAIVTLLYDVTFSKTVSPVCLPSGVSPPGTAVTVLGWGYVAEGGPLAENLREINITLLNSSSCREYQDLLTDGMLCGGTTRRDACQGDSGGPLLVQTDGAWHLAGVVSFGTGCAKPGYPGIYTSIARYNGWILSIIQ